MIIITLSHNQHQIKYKGQIDIQFDGDMFSIKCYRIENNIDISIINLYFWMDVDSICGEYDRIRIGNDGLIAEQYFAPGLTLRKQSEWK